MRFSPFLLLVTFAAIASCSTPAMAKDLIQIKSFTTNSQRELTDKSHRNLKGSVREVDVGAAERIKTTSLGFMEKFKSSAAVSKASIDKFLASLKTKTAATRGFLWKKRQASAKEGALPQTKSMKEQLAALIKKINGYIARLKTKLAKIRKKQPATVYEVSSSPKKETKTQLDTAEVLTNDLGTTTKIMESKPTETNEEIRKTVDRIDQMIAMIDKLPPPPRKRSTFLEKIFGF